jgi:hypothetical protein
MKIKNTLLLILFTIILSSCNFCNCVETHLTEDEKSWFSAYEKGQKIIFKSNLGNLDTIEITKKVETYGNKDCNWFEIGRIQNNIMSIEFKPKVCHNESYCDGGMYIGKDDINKKAFPTFILFGLTQKNGLKYLVPKQENIKLITTSKTYSQVYHFEKGVNAKSFGTNPPKSFYWDKKDGLIKYETKDGEVFELLKK